MADTTRNFLLRATMRRTSACWLAGALVLGACGGSELPTSDGPRDVASPDSDDGSGSAGTADDSGSASPAEPSRLDVDDFDVVVHDGELRPIAPELLGTNVPAWLGPFKLSDPTFVGAIDDLGLNLIRMPGGSWSNSYDWAACELRDENGCYFLGSARPSDFAALLATTGVEGMWTVSANHTAQSAAALVAFFNGSADDDRVIGVDRNGVDWETVGRWAELRAEGGHPEPIGIRWWEFGNEVYGGRPDVGGDACASFGWEDVWTCDGSEYVLGDDEHDGYLDVREAMLEIDPSIEVGAVGIAVPGEWSGWGDKVIELAGDDLDFYIVHEYGFDGSPDGDDAAARPLDLWQPMTDRLRDDLGGDVPIAITEYNLIAFGDGDTEQSMIRAVNALYLADSIGQMALAGVEAAAQWNLANGVMATGTDYGLIDADSLVPRPQYAAMKAWGSLGSTLLTSSGAVRDVRVYPTRHDDGTMSILAVHTGDDERSISIGLDVASDGLDATFSTSWAGELDATEMTDEAPVPIEVVARELVATLPPYSISVIEVTGG